MRLAILITKLLLAGLLAGAGQVNAGKIFLTGHDPDFHAQSSIGAQNLLRAGLNFVTGGTFDDGPASKFLWVESRVPTPNGHLIGEDGLSSLGLTLGTNYDRANGAEFASVNLANYTALVIASTFGGLLSQAELDALFARKNDIQNFVNSGRGLFAMAECDDSQSCQGDLVSNSASPFAYLPVVVSSVVAVPNFTVTPFGASLGLTDADVNDPTHNSFGLTGGLNVVDRDANNVPTTLAGDVRITNGGFVGVPEPGTLGILALGLALLSLNRRRRS